MLLRAKTGGRERRGAADLSPPGPRAHPMIHHGRNRAAPGTFFLLDSALFLRTAGESRRARDSLDRRVRLTR